MRRFIPFLLAALPVFATTVTTTGIDGFGTAVITGSAFAQFPGPLSASASASAITAESGAGFLVIDPTLSGGGGEFGSGSFSIGQYSWTCDDSGCHSSDPDVQFGKLLPFTLGVAFPVTISAVASPVSSGSGVAYFTFSVFEADIEGPFKFKGPSVTIYDPPAVPEPATILLSAGGLALLTLGQRIRARRAKP